MSTLLERMRNQAKNTTGLLAQLEAQTDKSKTKNYTDDRFWKLVRDKAGNGAAIIRFLPAPEGEKNHYITQYDHSFAVLGGKVVDGKTPGAKWYIEKSLSSLTNPETGKQGGIQDYLAEQNSLLWQTGLKENQEICRARGRRTNYYCNILVVNDPVNPDNNGKVFLFRFPKAILTMIKEQISPPDDEFGESKTPINPFDIDSGANFKLKIRNGENGYPTYDKSEFLKPSPICDGNEEEMIKVIESLYPVAELNDPKHFKSYDELKKRFLYVFGETPSIGSAETDIPFAGNKFEEEDEEDVPTFEKPSDPKPKEEKKTPLPTFDDDEDDDMAFFKQLAE